MKQWRLIFEPDPKNGVLNMAIDEALIKLHDSRKKSLTTLRIYKWSNPAITIGYSQSIEDAININYCKKKGIDIIRRITGGRAVLHSNELTYSIISSKNNQFPDSITNTYKIIQQSLLKGLSTLGVDTNKYSTNKKEIITSKNMACFGSSNKYEIQINGKKVAGSAQRRFRNSFIQHGSILLKANINDLLKCFKYNSQDKKAEYKKLLNSSMTGINNEYKNNTTYESLSSAVLLGFNSVMNIDFVHGRLTPEEEVLIKEIYNKKTINHLICP